MTPCDVAAQHAKAAALDSDDAAALAGARETAACFAEASDPRREAQALLDIAHALHQHGNPAVAIEVALDAVDAADRAGDAALIGWTTNWAGWILGDLGRPEEAVIVLDRAIRAGHQAGSDAIVGLATQERGNNLRRLGRLDEAESHLHTSIAIARRLHIPDGVAEGNAILAEIAMLDGRYAEAARLLAEAREVAAGMRYPQALSVAEETLGRLSLRLREPGAACDHFAEALDIAEGAGFARGEATALVGLSRCEADPELARDYAIEALRAYETLDSEAEGWSFASLGVLLSEGGDDDLAGSLFDEALPLLLDRNQFSGAALVETEQAWLFALAGADGRVEERLEAAAVDAADSGDLEAMWQSEWALAEELAASGESGLAADHALAALDALDALPPPGDHPALRADRDEAREGCEALLGD